MCLTTQPINKIAHISVPIVMMTFNAFLEVLTTFHYIDRNPLEEGKTVGKTCNVLWRVKRLSSLQKGRS